MIEIKVYRHEQISIFHVGVGSHTLTEYTIKLPSVDAAENSTGVDKFTLRKG